MTVKIKPADSAFSKCVRESNDWICERCGKQYERNSQGLHCSHVYSRRHRTIRWCKDNAQALCFSCHNWYEGNPPDSGPWVEQKIGKGALDLVREKMNQKVKVTKLEERDIAAHYREELRKLELRRINGETGKLDFESWQ